MSDSIFKANEVYFECQSNDVLALRSFYGDTLGFDIHPAEEIPEYLQVLIGGRKMTGFRKTSGQGDQISFYIHVNDLTKAFKLLQEKGLKPTPISTELWGQPATTVKDPDGRLVVFTREEM